MKLSTKFYYVPFAVLMIALLVSCSAGTLQTTKVVYQSVRMSESKSSNIPETAKIFCAYAISEKGELTVIVHNCTHEIMVIDQTMSFFVNSNGQSTSYYDPTVRSTTSTSAVSNTTGATVNLGSVGSFLGIGGSIGNLLNGINVGSSESVGMTNSNTTFFTDQPRISLAPKSHGAMSKVFSITGIGKKYLANANGVKDGLSMPESYCKFSVCISYSLDGGNNFEKIVTNFYANSLVSVPVMKHGSINDALRKTFETKPDAINEPWWMLLFHNNLPAAENIYDTRVQGIFYDYQL